ncbi:MAG: hypothetical protein JRH13_08870 [Deltaproteobacteria bacterium]|nr:hypothetical protein [Deltaproteobacteria bacterium]MBW2017028.1 hypothetical protein [Deltaproteobacteria bacterium]MBW2129462.1 hypothetical protein [Deltaproteobacteria bacterium]MBW2302169.1 hypothetical protein [Deltaproteobacteria bacterium]
MKRYFAMGHLEPASSMGEGLDRGRRSNPRPRARRLMLCLLLISAIAMLVSDCSGRSGDDFPRELIGEWRTDAEGYEDCSLELAPDTIIFSKGVEFIDVNFILRVRTRKEGRATLFDIDYENRDHQEFHLTLFYYRDSKGEILKFKNRRSIEWRKQSDDRAGSIPRS